MNVVNIGCALACALCLIHAPAGAAEPAAPRIVLVQFNGVEQDGVPANTQNEAFKAVFEKELAAISDALPGKPTLKIRHWWSIINGGAVEVTAGPPESAARLIEALKKKPYVKSAELDQAVSAGVAGCRPTPAAGPGSGRSA
jgi:hypothetical protein